MRPNRRGVGRAIERLLLILVLDLNLDRLFRGRAGIEQDQKRNPGRAWNRPQSRDSISFKCLVVLIHAPGFLQLPRTVLRRSGEVIVVDG